MTADPLAGGTGGQRSEQTTRAPEQGDMGIGADQGIVPIALADQDQRQGVKPASTGSEQHQHRPDQRCMQQHGNAHAGTQQHHPAAAEQGLPRHPVGQPADGQLQGGIAHHHGADHDQRQLLREAFAQQVDRQQGQDHGLEGGEQHHRPGNRRRGSAERQDAPPGSTLRIDLGRAIMAQQQQTARHQQARGEPEAVVALGAYQGQQQRPAQLAKGEAGAV